MGTGKGKKLALIISQRGFTDLLPVQVVGGGREQREAGIRGSTS